MESTGMDGIWDVIWRSVLAFVIMMVVARKLGKTTVSQMTYHDFVAAITLGAVTANLAFNTKMSFWEPLTSLVIFSGIAYLLMVVTLKSRKFRKSLSGRPTVVIQEGKILEGNLKKLKMNLDTLNQELRQKDVFNIEEVNYAVLELNGKLSVLKKTAYLPVVNKDMDINGGIEKNPLFPVELIMDGQIIEKNLNNNNLTKEWLLSEIQSQGKSFEDINYAVRSTGGQIFFDEYQDQIEKPIDRE